MDTDPDQAVWHMICLLEQIPFLKHPGFSQEGESRLIFRPFKKKELDNSITHSKVLYREAGHILVPYLKIYCGNCVDPREDLAHFIGWPVVSLTVGPGHDQDVVFESLIHRLEYGVTKFLPFSDEELLQAKKKYLLAFWEQLTPICPDFQSFISKVNMITSLNTDEAFCDIEMALHTNQIVQQKYASYCANNYLCTSGILIKKSQIPYIFN